jgi:hypothetical protein
LAVKDNNSLSLGIILNSEAIVLEIFIQILGMANTLFSAIPKGS